MNLMRKGLLDTIGGTPLVMLGSISRGLKGKIAAKLEGFNPGGSVKDRIALSMIEEAERRGLLKPGGRIVEPTSGNTGIGLALVSAVKGYSLTITMPESMSEERRKIMKSLGAEVVLTPSELGMKGAIEWAYNLASSDRDIFIPQQFRNQANPMVHYGTTGPEILAETGGEVGCFVSGVGTGGTITGVGRYLKEKKPGVRICAVEPEESPVLSGGEPGPHRIEGIGAGFVPEILDRGVIDEVMTVSYEEAREQARRLAREEGIFAGISSGAALVAAVALAKREDYEGKLIVVIFPDRGEKYLSTDLCGG